MRTPYAVHVKRPALRLLFFALATLVLMLVLLAVSALVWTG